MSRAGAKSVLLVEDDSFKQELLEAALETAHPGHVLAVARSVRHAVSLLGQCIYDLVVLDMALPSYDARPGGAQPMSQLSGGVEVLMELSYAGRTDRVVIVTQYPEIEFDGKFHSLARFPRVVREQISANIVGAVYFNDFDGRWRDQFLEMVS